MRRALALMLLAACAHPAVIEATAPKPLEPGDPCGAEPPAIGQDSAQALRGVTVEKVCLLGVQSDLVSHFEGMLSSQPGGPLDAERVEADILQLVAALQARQVTALAVPFATSPPQARLIFVVSRFPTLDELVVDGVSGDDAAMLRHGFEKGDGTSPYLIAIYVNRTRLALLRAGYVDVKVTPALEPLAPGSTRLRVTVTPGLRRVVKSLRFDGARLDPNAELAEAVHELIDQPYSQELADSRRWSVFQICSNHGLFGAHVTAGFEPKPTEAEPGAVEVVFTIDEGNQYRVAKVTIAGDAFPPGFKPAPVLRTRTGELYSATLLDADQAALQAMAKKKGLEVTVHPTSDVSGVDDTVDVEFAVNRKAK